MKIKIEKDVLEYLEWFWENADFGPADDDVRYIMQEEYESETGKKVPKGYRIEG